MHLRNVAAAGCAALCHESIANAFQKGQLQYIVDSTSPAPPPPSPEPVDIWFLPLPPAVASEEPGACTSTLNPHGTGCIKRQDGMLQSGGFLPDGQHLLAWVNFTGAPTAPDPAAIYTGDHLIVLKASPGTSFANGDTWKCITCGVPDENAVGRGAMLDYPVSFYDGKRILAGTNIIDCGDVDLVSPECTPEKIHIFPIRWNVTPDGSGSGGSMRELRLHPDNVHLGYSSIGVSAAGKLTQFSYFARLEFNPSPETGLPTSPRYDLVNVTLLFDETDEQPWSVQGSELTFHQNAITVGELRGFSGSGKEVTYIGSPVESSNIDVFATDLQTGEVRRLTAHPEYCDPVDISPDDNWTVAMDTRASGRQLFIAGMRYIPPILDLIIVTVASSTRNNGVRRFFQPWLIDHYGDRGTYFGQQLNAAGDGSPGSINDAEWNGRADPRWSPDGTRVAYWQALTTPPDCGGANPLPCQNSTEPGGLTERIVIAHLTTRTPLALERPVEPIPDNVPWGTRYVPGSPLPERPYPPEGTYTLAGTASGSATVVITENEDKTGIVSTAVSYEAYSNDGYTFLNGWENAMVLNPSPTLEDCSWFSDLTQTEGDVVNTKKTSPDGFHLSIDALVNLFEAQGTLTTTLDGRAYFQPANGT